MAPTNPLNTPSSSSRRMLTPIAPSRRISRPAYLRNPPVNTPSTAAESHHIPSTAETVRSTEHERKKGYGFCYEGFTSDEEADDEKEKMISTSDIPGKNTYRQRPQGLGGVSGEDHNPSSNTEDDDEGEEDSSGEEVSSEEDEENKAYSYDEDSSDDDDDDDPTNMKIRTLHSWNWLTERINKYFERSSPAPQTPPSAQRRRTNTPLRTPVSQSSSSSRNTATPLSSPTAARGGKSART